MSFKTCLFLVLLLFLESFYVLSSPVYSTDYIRIKPNISARRYKRYSFKNFIKFLFRIDSSAVVPFECSTSSSYSEHAPALDTPNVVESKEKSCLFVLPAVLLDLILEFVPDEYSNVRLVSRELRQIFDTNIYRLAWFKLPRANKLTFDDFKLKSHQLIPIVIVLDCLASSYKQKIIDGTFLQIFEVVYFSFITQNFFAEPMNPNDILKCKAFVIFRLLLMRSKRYGFMALSTFIKVGIIQWKDVEYMMIYNFDVLASCWFYGTLTIARELALHQIDVFIRSVGPEFGGLINSIVHRKLTLAHFMLEALPEYVLRTNRGYLDKVIEAVISSNFWDLLDKIYHKYPILLYHEYLPLIARKGSVSGLRVLHLEARKNPNELIHIAAVCGHLDLLKELNAMGLLSSNLRLNEDGQTIAHVSAASEHIECFKYILDQYSAARIDILNFYDFTGYLPIHEAALNRNEDILLEIVKRNARYTPPPGFRFNLFISSLGKSPLELAVLNNCFDNVVTLLNYFPELIEVKNSEGETVIHASIFQARLDILRLLLEVAPLPLIRTANKQGNTALHLAASHLRTERIAMLMETGAFTGLERNIFGQTAYALFCLRDPLCHTLRNRQLFGIDNLDEMNEFLKLEPTDSSSGSCYIF